MVKNLSTHVAEDSDAREAVSFLNGRAFSFRMLLSVASNICNCSPPGVGATLPLPPSIIPISCPRVPFSTIFYPLSGFFYTLAHSFALTKNVSLLFSIDSALFAQNTPGRGGRRHTC